MDMIWVRLDAGDNFDTCEVGSLNLYRFPDRTDRKGHVSVADDGCWISALFASPEAALSWAADWDGAETEFRRLNPPHGKGGNYVQSKPKVDA